MSSENGYSTLIAAARRFEESDVVIERDEATPAQWREYVDQHAVTIAEVRAALGSPCCVTLRYAFDEFSELVDGFVPVRLAALALAVAARDAAHRGELDNAVELAAGIADLSNAIRSGGLIVSSQVSGCILSIALEEVQRIAPRLSHPQRSRLRSRLQRVLAEREPFEHVLARDRDWELRTEGDRPPDESLVPEEPEEAVAGLDPELAHLLQQMIDAMAADPEGVHTLIASQDAAYSHKLMSAIRSLTFWGRLLQRFARQRDHGCGWFACPLK